MFQIVNTKTKRPVKNAITTRPMTFNTANDAQQFAESMIANWLADYRSQGRKLPRLEVVAA
jgi:hypothetical protein